MGSFTREYVKGDDPMYRSVTPYRWKNRDTGCYHEEVRYAGPYTTVGAAKRQRGSGGWIEVCHPTWERLEE